MDYVVKTEVFEGPFDLLLHLIARQRVDIWQVSLSRITEDYLAEVRRMRELNLEVATEFLVVAATLLELKAARLLPAPDADPDEIEAVLEDRKPILSSGAPMVSPRSSDDTRNPVMPRVPASGLVIAMTTYHCASPALVIQALAPFRT